MNRRSYATVLAAAVVLLAGAAVYFLWSGSPMDKAGCPDIGDSLAKSVTSEMEGFRFVEQGQGGTSLEVSAKKAVLRNRKYRQFRLATGKVLELDGPVFLVYGEDGKATEISGLSAVVDPIKKTVSFEDAVVKAPGGARLEAARLDWRYARSYMQADGACTIRRGGRSVEGVNTSTDMRLNKITVK